MLDDQALATARSLPSFRSPSGKRMHPRVQLPSTAEIGGEAYQLKDWSLGGCALAEPGPPAKLGDPVRIRLRIGSGSVGLVIEGVAKVVRAASGRAEAFQFISLPSDSARLLDRLAEAWFAGEKSNLEFLLQGQQAAEPQTRLLRRWAVPTRAVKTGAALAAGVLLLLLGAGFVLSRWMVVYSDFAAVASTLHLLRAPASGVVTMPGAVIGSVTRAGQPLVLLDPAVPPQVQAEMEARIQAIDARLGQLRGELRQAEEGFANFRRRMQAELDTAGTTRRLAARQVAAQERMHQRLSELARQGLASQLRVDQTEVEVMAQRRSLAEAAALEEEARRRLEDAVAGRFASDGRSSQAAPGTIAREIEALEAQKQELRRVASGLNNRVTLSSPCDCQVAYLGATSGSYIASGEPIMGLAEIGEGQARELDALVNSTLLSFLRRGQEVTVYLAGDPRPVPATIAAINYNPENTGRVGLPDNLRTLKRYGLVTVRLQQEARGVASGLPALVKAPIETRMLLRNIPGLSWLVSEAGTSPSSAQAA